MCISTNGVRRPAERITNARPKTTEGHGVVAVALVVLCCAVLSVSEAVGQWSAGRTWYSKSSPPTQISRMIAEIAIAQK